MDIIVPGKKTLMDDKIASRKKLENRQKNFVDSLEIVRDAKKIKNYRRKQGEPEEKEAKKRYEANYAKAFGHEGAIPGSTGTYKYDEKLKKMVKVSDEVPQNFKGLIAL